MMPEVLQRLARRYDNPAIKKQLGDIVLLVSDQRDPHDVVIATLLAARTTDKQVAKVYPALKQAYPTIEALAKASADDIAQHISTIGLYRQKAKAIAALARIVRDTFGGVIPRTMEELVTLPGVGRKTASVVLSTLFREPAIAVDTHVNRIAHRLHWAHSSSYTKVEQEIMTVIPREYWNDVNRLCVPFGREYCKAIRPRCYDCPIRDLCPYQNKTPQPKTL